MPTPLPSHLLKDARLYANRYDLLEAILPSIKGGTFCEIGVAAGDFSSFLIEKGHPRAFHSIDTFELDQLDSLWGRPINDVLEGKSHYQYYTDKMASVAIPFGTEIHIHRGYSFDVLANVPDRSCDLVYVDADHSYESVSKDTAEASRIVKDGGIIVFNDYTMFDTIANAPFGVVDVVNEFISENEFKVLGLGLEQNMFCDLAVQYNV